MKTRTDQMSSTMKYKVIKTKKQYDQYCNILEDLILEENSKLEDEIELLTLLIEKWDNDHNTFLDSDPITILKNLMEENNLKAKDLVNILDLSKGTVSKILNYHKGLSKESIRKLSTRFKVSQEVFNRPYKIIHPVNRHFRHANLMNTTKNVEDAAIA